MRSYGTAMHCGSVDSSPANRMQLISSELDAVPTIIELRQHIYHAWRTISPTSDTLSATLPLTFTQAWRFCSMRCYSTAFPR